LSVSEVGITSPREAKTGKRSSGTNGIGRISANS
jgi:hypothetical protein